MHSSVGAPRPLNGTGGFARPETCLPPDCAPTPRHQRLVDAEMQVFGMAEPPHGQTAGLHSLHKRVLCVPVPAIEFPFGGGLVRSPADGCAIAQAIDADRDSALPDPLQAELGRGLNARRKISPGDNGLPGFAHRTLSLRDRRPVFGMLSQL